MTSDNSECRILGFGCGTRFAFCTLKTHYVDLKRKVGTLYLLCQRLLLYLPNSPYFSSNSQKLFHLLSNWSLIYSYLLDIVDLLLVLKMHISYCTLRYHQSINQSTSCLFLSFFTVSKICQKQFSIAISCDILNTWEFLNSNL